MKLSRAIIVLTLLSFSWSANGQKDTVYAWSCVYKDRYAAEKRRGSYPFSQADSIVLVSFKYHYEKLPISKNEVVHDSLFEQRWIAGEEIDELTDILYNNFFKSSPSGDSKCFFPRNAVLFYKNNTLFEYVILCFSCDTYEKSTPRVNLGDDCEEKMSKLRNYFRDKGIDLGTDPKIREYPGETFR